jgi:hypothetical protein
MPPPTGMEQRAIVDAHRHPIRAKLAAKMAERGFYDLKQEITHTNVVYDERNARDDVQ